MAFKPLCELCHHWHWPHEKCPSQEDRRKYSQETPQRVGVLYDLRMSLAQGGSHAG